jgi:hypothetical protein
MIILELKLVTENYEIIYLVNRLSEFEKYINSGWVVAQRSQSESRDKERVRQAQQMLLTT